MARGYCTMVSIFQIHSQVYGQPGAIVSDICSVMRCGANEEWSWNKAVRKQFATHTHLSRSTWSYVDRQTNASVAEIFLFSPHDTILLIKLVVQCPLSRVTVQTVHHLSFSFPRTAKLWEHKHFNTGCQLVVVHTYTHKYMPIFDGLLSVSTFQFYTQSFGRPVAITEDIL